MFTERTLAECVYRENKHSTMKRSPWTNVDTQVGDDQHTSDDKEEEEEDLEGIAMTSFYVTFQSRSDPFLMSAKKNKF